MAKKDVFDALDSLEAARYEAAFESLRLHKCDLKMLQTHYQAPDQTITASRMAGKMGFKGFGASNLHYGTLAKRVGKFLGLRSETSLLVLATFDWPSGECDWIMRPQVAEALEKLGWVGRPKRGKN